MKNRKKALSILLSLTIIFSNIYIVKAEETQETTKTQETSVEKITTQEGEETEESTTAQEQITIDKGDAAKSIPDQKKTEEHYGVTREKQETETKEKNESVKEEKKSTKREGSISFDQKSLNTKIGCFQPYAIQMTGIDDENIESIKFDIAEEDQKKLEFDNYGYYDENDNYSEMYIPIAKKEGDVSVTLKITMDDNDKSVFTATGTFHIQAADEGIVPLVSYTIYNLFDDADNDYQIDEEEAADECDLDLSYENLENEDLAGLEWAVNCEEINLERNDNISDISFMKNMNKLKNVNLRYTDISKIDVLEKNKNTLETLYLPSGVLAENRVKLIKNAEVIVEAGAEMTNPIRPKGLFENCVDASFSAEDNTILNVNDQNQKLILSAVDGITEGSTKLKIMDLSGKELKSILIRIKDKNTQSAGFLQDNENISMGYFGCIALKNIQNQEDEIEIISNNPNILEVSRDYEYDENDNEYAVFHYEPKSEGTTTLKGIFQKEDGTTYTETMTVKVSGQESGVMPFKNYYIYNSMYSSWRNKADENGDYKISAEELRKVTEMYFNEGEITKSDADLLAQAVNCKYISLNYNDKIDNIEFMRNMKKLESVYLKGTNVKDISILKDIKNQLSALYLPDTIDVKTCLSFVKDKIYVKAGRSYSNFLEPYGVLSNYGYDTVSSNSSVVEVVKDKNEGEYIRINKGQEGKTANLTIRSGGLQKTIQVIVTNEEGEVPVEKISLNTNSLSLQVGQSEQLIARYEPNYATLTDATWISSNTTVAEVSATGRVIAKAPGMATITVVTTNGKAAYCSIRVTDKSTPTKPTPTKPRTVKVSKISLSGVSKKIAAGKKIKLKAKVSPSNASNKGVTWKSSNKKVATVNSKGVVTIKKKTGGKSVTITATAKDGSKRKATYKIKVMKGVVKKVSISGKKTVKAGKTLKLKVKISASKGANRKIKWTCSNTKYATVSSSGKVKAKKAGKRKKIKITAMATDGSGKKKTITIKIK